MRRVRDRVSKDVRQIGLRTTIWASRPYQPVGDLRGPARERPESAFQTRWEAVAAAATAGAAHNLLEVGCAEGYFVRRAARELGLFSMGVEGDWTRVGVGTALAELGQERGYGFAFGMFSPSEIRAMPRFDIVVCFSVVHHVINRAGLDEATAFLSALASITTKRFLFDMGGPDETSHSWAERLRFLGPDVDKGIVSLLAKAGFTDIQRVGETLGHRDVVKRSIFSCAPPSDGPRGPLG
jgi:hypothetical protein